MMSRCRFVVAAVAAVAAVAVTAAAAAPLAAQEVALKGGIAISRFQSTGAMPPGSAAGDPARFDDSFVSTSFGGHARFSFGRFALQPELQMVSRGASISETATNERIRLEYMELPVMLVVPIQVGAFEPYAFGGPMLSLETRCRSIIEENNLKTNLGCDDEAAGNSFDRRVFDYGVSAGAGISHRLGSGRVLLEGRHTWGLRNIYDGAVEGVEVRNRSLVFSIGYSIVPDEME
ncbi:MAG: porin family protein [Longimicrobiales bacterium]